MFVVHIPAGNIIHLVFEMIAYSVGFQYYLRLRRLYGDTLSGEDRIVVLIGTIGGAFLLSRLVGVMEYPRFFVNIQDAATQFFASQTIVGGLLGGLAGTEIAKKIIGVRQSTGD